MKRLPFWGIAVLIAAAAMGLTLWLSGEPAKQPRPRPGPPSQPGSSRIAFVRAVNSDEQIPHPRIVALAPGVAQIVRDLGCGYLLVGRHASDAWSDQSLPVCGDQSGIDYERLIALNPTHVFLQWGEKELPERLTALANEKQWKVHNVPLLKLTDISNAVLVVHDNTAQPELAALRWERLHTRVDPFTGAASPETAEIERRIRNAPDTLLKAFDAAMEADASLAGAGRILLLYQGEGEANGGGGHPAALGPGSYHHDILLRIGGRSATEEGKPFMPLDAEDVGRLKPDGIIIVRPRGNAQGPAATDGAKTEGGDLTVLLGAIATLDIPAVKNRRVALVNDTMSLVPGTNLARVADKMREILKEWAK